MKIIEDHNYGADADGNRGIHIKFYELEQSDSDVVIEALKKELGDYEVTITLTAPDGEEIDFDIIVKDFL